MIKTYPATLITKKHCVACERLIPAKEDVIAKTQQYGKQSFCQFYFCKECGKNVQY